MTKLPRCLAAVVTTTCFLASPSIVFAGEGPSADEPDAAQTELEVADDADPAEGTNAPAPRAEAGSAESSAEQAERPAPSLQLEAPRLEYGDQGPARGRGDRLVDAGVALTVLGGVSLVGSTFWLMVCPSDPEQVTVGQGMFEDTYEIKCFDAKSKVQNRFLESQGVAPADAEVTLKAGAGNPVLPGLITMAAAGGVMLGTGIALLVVGAKRKKQGMTAAPMFNGSTAGMMLSGKF